MSETSYNSTSRRDVEYHIPKKGEPDYVAVIPALEIDSTKAFDVCQYVTNAYVNLHGVWTEVRELEYVTLHLDTTERYFTIEISQERYLTEIAPYYGEWISNTDNSAE
jgi:hypothetical protein